jgi:hypothetical protein
LFPGCLKPAEWADRHHIIAWRDGGTTDLGNLTLLCGPHHREFQRKGWTCQMVDGLPWWVPPKWLDPDQKPRQNTRAKALTPSLRLCKAHQRISTTRRPA